MLHRLSKVHTGAIAVSNHLGMPTSSFLCPADQHLLDLPKAEHATGNDISMWSSPSQARREEALTAAVLAVGSF